MINEWFAFYLFAVRKENEIIFTSGKKDYSKTRLNTI